MQVKETTYIFPPRADARIPITDAIVLYEDLDWYAQLKYNDSRCLIKRRTDGIIELWNRHGERFRDYNAPDWLLQELDDVLTKTFNLHGYCLLDGGLLDKKHRAIKDTIVIWDILVENGEHLLETTYDHRYQRLHPFDEARHWDSHSGPHDPSNKTWYYHNLNPSAADTTLEPFGEYLHEHVFMPRNIKASEWAEAWAFVQRINKPFVEANPPIGPLLEGLVFKNPEGILGMGFTEKNNTDWMSRSRVSTGRHAF